MKKPKNALFFTTILLLTAAGFVLLWFSVAKDDAPSWVLPAALACVVAGSAMNVVWRILRRKAEDGRRGAPKK